MIRVTVLFPKTSDSHFDMDYYLSKHVPMTTAKLQSLGIPVEAEVDQGWAASRPVSPLPMQRSDICFLKKWKICKRDWTTHGAEIMADIPNFTNVQPQIQVGNIVFGA